MPLNYGTPANPEAFVIVALKQLGLPVGPERELLGSLPGYVVTSISPHHDRHMLNALISVHSFAQATNAAMGRAAASDAAWNADSLLTSLTPADTFLMPDGRRVGAWVDNKMGPAFADYHDPFIKRYVARYNVALKFQPKPTT